MRLSSIRYIQVEAAKTSDETKQWQINEFKEITAEEAKTLKCNYCSEAKLQPCFEYWALTLKAVEKSNTEDKGLNLRPCAWVKLN